MNKLEENISAVQAAMDLAKEFPKHSDINELSKIMESENTARIAAAATAVSFLPSHSPLSSADEPPRQLSSQSPSQGFDYDKMYKDIFNDIKITLPGLGSQTTINGNEHLVSNKINTIASAATGVYVQSTSFPYQYIYENLNIKLPSHSTQQTVQTGDHVANNEGSSNPESIYTDAFDKIFKDLQVILPSSHEDDKTIPVAAAAVAASVNKNHTQQQKKRTNSLSSSSSLSSNGNIGNQDQQNTLPLHDQLYLYIKLLSSSIYISDYDVKKLISDIEKKQSSKHFAYDKNQYKVADEIGGYIIKYYAER